MPALKTAPILLVLTTLLAGGCAQRAKVLVWRPAESQIDGITRLAILDFEGEGENGRIARSTLVAQFFDNRHYSLVDPAELARIRPLTKPDGTPDSAAALEAARVANVDALLTGQVVNYKVQDNTATDHHVEFLGSNGENKKTGWVDNAMGVAFDTNHTLTRQGSVSLAVKLIDVRSGEIRAARQFSHAFNGQVVNGKGTLPGPDTVLTNLLHECAQDTVAMLAPHHSPVEVTLAKQYYGKGLAALSRGNKLAISGNWTEASANWEAALKENSKNHAARYNLALAAEARQDYPTAMRQMDAAIAAYPSKLYNQTRRRMRDQQREFLAASTQAAGRRAANLAAMPAPASLPVQAANFQSPNGVPPQRLPPH